MEIKHYGPIRAEIDHQQKSVTVRYVAGYDPLPRASVLRCLEWAVADTEELGYLIKTELEHEETIPG